MARLLQFESFNAFYHHNYAHMAAHFYVYFHVFKMIPRLEQQELDVHNGFNVVDDDGRQIIGLEVTGSSYLFSFGWTEAMLDIAAAQVRVPERQAGFTVVGQRELVQALLARTDRPWRVFKDRLVYDCTAVVTTPPQAVEAQVENAAPQDLDRLAELTLAFDREEYPDKPRHDPQQAYGQAAHGVRHGKMFVVRHRHQVCSILQAIETPDFDYLLLGSLYTAPPFRNRGYAALLLHTVTDGFLQAGFAACGLFSDRTNPASNKVFAAVGYRPVYDWLSTVLQ